MARALRVNLVAAHRDTFGCTIDGCQCFKHLVVPGLETEPDPEFRARIRFLYRLESMHAVGCVFAPNDLSPVTWRDLIDLARARTWLDGKVDAHRAAIRDRTAEEHKGIDQMRKQEGIAPPGASLFSVKK